MNSMSLSGTPARYAMAMPSPVLIAPLVVKGKMRPQPPVAMITALAWKHMEAALVGCIPGAFDLHPAEGAHRHLAGRLAAPRTAPMLHLQQLTRSHIHEQLDRVLVAQPVAARDGVV